jgi:hypothetical protein
MCRPLLCFIPLAEYFLLLKTLGELRSDLLSSYQNGFLMLPVEDRDTLHLCELQRRLSGCTPVCSLPALFERSQLDSCACELVWILRICYLEALSSYSPFLRRLFHPFSNLGPGSLWQMVFLSATISNLHTTSVVLLHKDKYKRISR